MFVPPVKINSPPFWIVSVPNNIAFAFVVKLPPLVPSTVNVSWTIVELFITVPVIDVLPPPLIA